MNMLVFTILATVSGAGQEPAKQPSALEQDPAGWIDLFNGKDLAGWKRAAILPDTKLGDKNAWSVDAANKVLVCDGVGIKEMLLHEKKFADGIFHVEWRFRPVKDKDKEPILYNSGIYVRTGMDGKVWHQAQVAHNNKPPFMGDLFGMTQGAKGLDKFLVEGTGPKRIKGPGEWNTYEITCQGKTVSVWINGGTTCTWKDCLVADGHFGLQAEFFFIEFRKLRFKEVKR